MQRFFTRHDQLDDDEVRRELPTGGTERGIIAGNYNGQQHIHIHRRVHGYIWQPPRSLS